MNISLPDELHAAAEHLAARAGFKSADEYVTELVRQDLALVQGQDPDYFLRQALAEAEGPASVPSEALQQRKREIEALLIEGLSSGPAAPMKPGDWEDIRREVRERQERRAKS